MKNNNITIGTRGSKLALWQSKWVKSALHQTHEQLEIDLRIIRTTGDKILDTACLTQKFVLVYLQGVM